MGLRARPRSREEGRLRRDRAVAGRRRVVPDDHDRRRGPRLAPQGRERRPRGLQCLDWTALGLAAVWTARLLGSDAILVVAGLVTNEIPYNEVYQRCVDALRPLGETAARAGVKIGCENCNSEQRFLLSPREFWQFLNDVNSPAVGIHLDVGNIHDTGFAEQWIEIHGPR
ncbi:MAG: hypothetical protein DMD66_06805, partial [Gemmatimonadetes bacterium]